MEQVNVLIIDGQRLAIVGCSDEDAMQLAKAISLTKNVPVFIEKQNPLDFIESDPHEQFIEVTNDLHLSTIDDYDTSDVIERSYRQNVRDFLAKNHRLKYRVFERKPRFK